MASLCGKGCASGPADAQDSLCQGAEHPRPCRDYRQAAWSMQGVGARRCAAGRLWLCDRRRVLLRDVSVAHTKPPYTLHVLRLPCLTHPVCIRSFFCVCGVAESWQVGMCQRICRRRGSPRLHVAHRCLYSQICSNGAQLFELEVDRDWQCSFSEARFRELQGLLLQPLEESREDMSCQG